MSATTDLLVLEDGTGLPNATSYASLDEANAYFAARLYADAWTTAAVDDQAKALMFATLLIDTTYKFNGTQTVPAQRLAWPRLYCPNTEQTVCGLYPDFVASGMVSFGGWYGLGGYWPPNTVPRPVKAACCELAGELLKQNRLALVEPAQAGIKSMNLGQGAVQFTFDASDRPKVFPQTVNLLLMPLGSNRVGSAMKRVRRA